MQPALCLRWWNATASAVPPRYSSSRNREHLFFPHKPPLPGHRWPRVRLVGWCPPIGAAPARLPRGRQAPPAPDDLSQPPSAPSNTGWSRSEEHTSELQSLRHLVCRLLLEKKKQQQ